MSTWTPQTKHAVTPSNQSKHAVTMDNTRKTIHPWHYDEDTFTYNQAVDSSTFNYLVYYNNIGKDSYSNTIKS